MRVNRSSARLPSEERRQLAHLVVVVVTIIITIIIVISRPSLPRIPQPYLSMPHSDGESVNDDVSIVPAADSARLSISGEEADPVTFNNSVDEPPLEALCRDGIDKGNENARASVALVSPTWTESCWRRDTRVDPS